MRIIETSQIKPGEYDSLSTVGNWIYNGLDCCVTAEVFQNIQPDVSPVAESTYRFSMDLMAPILEMNLRGILVDIELRDQLLLDYGQDCAKLERNFNRIMREGFSQTLNPNSPKAMQQFFYETLGMPKVMKRNTKGEYRPTVNREALEKFRDYYQAAPIVNHLLKLRDTHKRLGFLRTSISADNRFRTNFNIAGTNTGRLASSMSDLGDGSNLQNIEERLRRIFIPDPGYKFANIDLEQADSRNIGALCYEIFGDARYLDACESGDLHTYVCKLSWPDKPWTGDKVKDRAIADENFYRDKSFRDAAKALGHGTNYLGTSHTMAKNTKIPEDIVREFQKRYFRAFPAIPKLHQWVEQTLWAEGALTTLLGRHRFFQGRLNDKSTIREAVAYLGQSQTSDELNRGMLKVWQANLCQLLGQVHDSVLVQYPEDQEDQLLPQIREHINTEVLLRGHRKFIVPNEAKVGWNWSNASTTNPLGLRKYRLNDERKRTQAA